MLFSNRGSQHARKSLSSAIDVTNPRELALAASDGDLQEPLAKLGYLAMGGQSL